MRILNDTGEGGVSSFRENRAFSSAVAILVLNEYF